MIDPRGGPGYCTHCKTGPISRADLYCVDCILASHDTGPEFERRRDLNTFKCLKCGEPVEVDSDRYCKACIDTAPDSENDPRIKELLSKPRKTIIGRDTAGNWIYMEG